MDAIKARIEAANGEKEVILAECKPLTKAEVAELSRALGYTPHATKKATVAYLIDTFAWRRQMAVRTSF